jgi:glycine C-acetyltransferase
MHYGCVCCFLSIDRRQPAPKLKRFFVKQDFLNHLQQETAHVQSQGLYKEERPIASAQGAWIKVQGREVLNLCANNYLGLANHPEVVQAAHQALENYGYGMSSVRFICGTQTMHQTLESTLSAFLGMDDTILYSSCFDANGGLFETLLDAQDAVISDALNHASIIDGIRLCKAARYRYANNDMASLEEQLKKASQHRFKLIATDGVFSMDGSLAHLQRICDLADAYGAMVMVDDSHAFGFVGENGRGSVEACGVMGRVDIITGTLGKAVGGAAGGFTSARAPIVTWLRQRSRPYLFSNALPPVVVGASLAALKVIQEQPALRHTVRNNSAYFRKGLASLGFTVLPGEHAIIPVMLGDAALAVRMASALLQEGVYVTGFSYPVVPMGQARIRTQMSAVHTQADLDHALHAFGKTGKALGVLA